MGQAVLIIENIMKILYPQGNMNIALYHEITFLQFLQFSCALGELASPLEGLSEIDRYGEIAVIHFSLAY